MNTTTRIAIDASLACSKRPTGVEHFARSLLAELVRLDLPEVEWCVYLPPFGDPGCELPPTVRTRYRPDVNTLIKQPWFAAQTWRDHVDVVYAFGHLSMPACRGKYVLTVHDLAFEEYPDCYPPGAPETARTQVRETCRRATRIVVPSEATRQALIAGYGYPSQKIDVILEGSRDVFSPGAPGPLPARVIEAGIRDPFLLSVGRLDRRKNVERVIEAYRTLVRRGVPCGGLVIAGPDDSGAPEVRARLEAGRVEGERIVTTGYVQEEELLSLNRQAAVVVYPSLAEGFGLPVLEAMACGTAVVTSNVSSMPEVAGDAALLVDPHSADAIADALQRVLTETGLREKLQARGLRQAQKLTWKASAERLAASLIRAGGRAGSNGRASDRDAVGAGRG